MNIGNFIRDHLQKRLDEHTSLVVYDPEKLYREIVLGLASQYCTVVDAGESIILGREQAMEAWLQLAESSEHPRHLLVYVPAPKPVEDEDKWRDPFRIFALGGTEFPLDDGDTYQALCHRAKPDYVQQIDGLFKHGVPDFVTIDNVGGGKNWPKLRTLLAAESAVEVLCGLLAPSEAQNKALAEDKTWLAEFKEFGKATVGFVPVTKSQNWQKIHEELWRFVLFSEFVWDLPGNVPSSLTQVPRAGEQFKPLIMGLCQRLRTSEPCQPEYIDMAQKVAADLDLEQRMQSVEALGVLDTFAFEERSYLKIFVTAALKGELMKAKEFAAGRKTSLWVRNSDRQLMWTIAERGMELLVAAEDLKDLFAKTGRTTSAIFVFYCERGRQLDTLQRSFEQAVAEAFGELGVLEELVEAARKAYRGTAEDWQMKFIAAVEAEGWPVSGTTRGTEVFERFLAPALLDREKKVALVMVDALRYELAGSLVAALATDNDCELHGACAQLPTITPRRHGCPDAGGEW